VHTIIFILFKQATPVLICTNYHILHFLFEFAKIITKFAADLQNDNATIFRDEKI